MIEGGDHGALLQELYNLIVAVPDFSTITGVAIGNNQPDPTLARLTPPACWVAFVGDQESENDGNIVDMNDLVFMFAAFIYLPMGMQSEIIAGALHLPLLKKIISGVHGKDSPTTGHRWSYKGQKLALVNTDRMVYAQRYTITGVL